MRKEIYKIVLTSLISMLVALLQAYLVHVTGTSVPVAVPALAGVNGALLAISHALSKIG